MPETMLRQLVTLVDLPALRAATDPDAACIRDGDLTLDNAAFLERILRAAAALARRGVGHGDVVAAVIPNRAELLVVLFAAWRLGAAVVPVRPTMSRAELEFQVEDCGARVTVGDGLDLHTETIHVGELLGDVVASDLPVAPSDTAAVSLLIYTRGTGRPRAVVLDAANLLAMCRSAAEALEIDDRDHCLVLLPASHLAAIVMGMLMPLLAGGQTTLAAPPDAAAFSALLGGVRPTYVLAGPAVYAELAQLPPASASPDTSSLRFALCGTGPLEPELIGSVERRLGAALINGYGRAEATCVSTLNPIAGPRTPGTVGLAMPGQEVRIMDRNGTFSAPGDPGEVVIRGPVLMRGYLNQAAATSRAIGQDGWLHTGDAGVLDEDGHLRIVGTLTDLRSV